MSMEILSNKAGEAIKHIRQFIMDHGRMPSTRELMKEMKYKSTLSVVLLLNELALKGFIEKKVDGTYKFLKDLVSGESARTVLIPLVGFANCGSPMLAEENVEAMIPVSTSLAKSGYKYFLLRAKGDSMNKVGIQPGDLLLVRQQPTAENGQIVVALIDDEATVKEFLHKGNIVQLLPRSTNEKHQPIILSEDFSIQGIVVNTIPTS